MIKSTLWAVYGPDLENSQNPLFMPQYSIWAQHVWWCNNYWSLLSLFLSFSSKGRRKLRRKVFLVLFFFLGRHGISGTKYKSCHGKKFLASGLFCGLQRVFRVREGVRVRRDRGVDNGLCPRCQNTFRTVKPAMANHGQLKRRKGLPEVVQCSAPIYQCFSLASMT